MTFRKKEPEAHPRSHFRSKATAACFDARRPPALGLAGRSHGLQILDIRKRFAATAFAKATAVLAAFAKAGYGGPGRLRKRYCGQAALAAVALGQAARHPGSTLPLIAPGG